MQDLSDAVHEGIHVLGWAAKEIGQSFDEARRELIRFGLDPQGEGAASSGWYAGDEEE